MLLYNNTFCIARTGYVKPECGACRHVLDLSYETVMTAFFQLTVALALILGGISKAAAGEMNVVASIFPLHSLAAGVMNGVGEPTLLLEGGLSPHDFALKPSQARILQSADLLIWVGESLEYPLARFAGNLPPGRSFPLNSGADARQNPHIWLDPREAKRIVSAVVLKLRALDPGHPRRQFESVFNVSSGHASMSFTLHETL